MTDSNKNNKQKQGNSCFCKAGGFDVGAMMGMMKGCPGSENKNFECDNIMKMMKLMQQNFSGNDTDTGKD